MLDSVDYAQTGVGTPLYFSPEICKGEKYNYKTDMWMLGCLFYELCTLARPFQSESINVLIENIINNEPKSIENNYSVELKNIIYQLLKKSPEDRWGIRELYKNETFLNYSNIYSKVSCFGKHLDINKLKINIEDDNNIPLNNNVNSNYRDLSTRKFTPSYGKADINKIIKNLRLSPRISPINKQLEITDNNLSHLDLKENKFPNRKISTNSCTSTTTEIKPSNIPKPVRPIKLNNKTHFKHISINILSSQSPDNQATYKVENIEKIDEIEFPKAQVRVATPTHKSLQKKSSFEIFKDIPRSTKVRANKRYDNNLFKQFLITKYGEDKFNRMYKSIIENNNKLDEKMIKEIVGEDYSDALNYAKYLIEYDNN
jgi:serine/threonine protein kinase